MGDSRRPCRVAIADDSPAFVAAAADYVAGMPGYVVAGTAQGAAQAVALVGKEAFVSGLAQILAALFPAKVAA